MSERVEVLDRVRRLLWLFGTANDADDHHCGAEGGELRARAATGLRELSRRHAVVAEVLPGLAGALDSRHVEGHGWSNLVDAIDREIGPEVREGIGMSENQRTVERYMEAFGRLDHAAVLDCLTDDVEWLIPGAFHVRGKPAFDREIENEAFVGAPQIRVTRRIEGPGVVVAEGSVRAARRDGGTLHVVFCDLFEMREGKVCRLTSYLMEVEDPGSESSGPGSLG